MLKKIVLFSLCLFYSFSSYAYDSILNKFINKRIDGCVVTNIKYNEVTKNILIVCIKDTTKVYHFYLDITAGYECGDFKCGSENVTKEVLDLLSK
jgi:hypothetical protein